MPKRSSSGGTMGFASPGKVASVPRTTRPAGERITTRNSSGRVPAERNRETVARQPKVPGERKR